MQQSGKIFVVTGPSGVGKDTLVQRVLATVPGITKSISATTRTRRPGEIDGKSYYFVNRAEFEAMRDSGKFLEWAEFAGNLYGTPRSYVEEQINNGLDVILAIEVQGAMQVAKACTQAVRVFISPPSFEELENRLRKRATESPEKIAMRLDKGKKEIIQKHLFDYDVVNNQVEEAVNNLIHIILAERCRIPGIRSEKQ